MGKTASQSRGGRLARRGRRGSGVPQRYHFGEIRNGIERLPGSEKRHRLEQWLEEELPFRFENRLLPVDAEVADRWGRLTQRARVSGRPIGAMDAFIAACADRFGLTLVTRNISDFDHLGLQLINPWN